MKKSLSILLLVAGLFSAPVYSQDYYVCNNGSDINSGLSAAEPWATFDYAVTRFRTINAGDSVLFCRGGSFNSSRLSIVNFNCTKDEPCTFEDYLPPSASEGVPMPVITGNELGAFKFSNGGNAEADGGYVIKNLNIKGIGDGYGIFLFNDVNYVTIDSVIIDGFSVGVYSAKANIPNPGADQKNDFITLKNSQIINNKGDGWLGGGDDLVVENNKFINNGFDRKNLNHNFYGSDINRGRIVGNEFYKSTFIENECYGVSLVVHGVVDDLLIKDNLIHEDLAAARPICWGISVDPAYSTEESFNNVLIIGNRVENVGNVSIGCASCTNSAIIDNTIVHGQDYAADAIRVPVRTEDLVKSDNIVIRFNDIMLIDTNNRGKNGIVMPNDDGFSQSANVIH